ncbi:hypothetical protein MYCTH_2297764 [Thermothelomyces thermophilus ATCC 42464]|uniref:Uncharacterized protein n=1 Tax=Thermothelomyces thermophilus (strain ATCC 42464 / BCRC 31852 / DSM 1799) TaxID=573729 RepID=G2Q6Z2_THET4|nr:uncharacterized protein MYCTH_2297764 [Thermothelomyces thermophilus ATCC 42464]AEO54772.1 hypothetical protein MYCTH_2297764 [Thermothelomyces thermophilus ATCC 42464]
MHTIPTCCILVTLVTIVQQLGHGLLTLFSLFVKPLTQLPDIQDVVRPNKHNSFFRILKTTKAKRHLLYSGDPAER